MFVKYSVIIEKFAERHFIKSFSKKYKNAGEVTLRAIIEELKRVDGLFELSIAKEIKSINNLKIIKTEFKIAGTKQSRHGSGNRCIAIVDEATKIVRILMIYHKNDLKGSGGETVKWQKVVGDNFLEYRSLV